MTEEKYTREQIITAMMHVMAEHRYEVLDKFGVEMPITFTNDVMKTLRTLFNAAQ